MSNKNLVLASSIADFYNDDKIWSLCYVDSDEDETYFEQYFKIVGSIAVAKNPNELVDIRKFDGPLYAHSAETNLKWDTVVEAYFAWVKEQSVTRFAVEVKKEEVEKFKMLVKNFKGAKIL